MKRLTNLAVHLVLNPRILWVVVLLTLLAVALASGAPDAGSCVSSVC